MSKFKWSQRISSVLLTVVLTLSTAMPYLSTAFTSDASGTKIGWKELGVTENTTYSTSQIQTIGTASTADFSNLEFEGIINLGSSSSDPAYFGFGDNGSTKAFYIQVNESGSVYLKWNSQVIRYLNTPSVAGSDIGAALKGVDLILNLKMAFAADTADTSLSKGSLVVTLKDAATGTQLYTETFKDRSIGTADLEATAWVLARNEAKVTAKMGVADKTEIGWSDLGITNE